MEKRELSYTVGGNVNWYTHYGKLNGGCSETKNRVAIWSSNPTPRHISKQNYNLKRYRHLNIHSSTTSNSQHMEPKCPWTNEWIRKMWYIYTVEYYSVIKKDEIMPLTATWIDLEIITLGEVNQKEKDKLEKAMATHSSTSAWKIPWTEEPGRLHSMVSLGVGHDWVTSLSFFTFMHWRRKWQATPVFLPGQSQGRGGLVGWRLWGHTESDTSDAT